MRVLRLLFFLFLLSLAGIGSLFAQNAPIATTGDSAVLIEILEGVRKFELRKVNDSTQLQILAGNVRLKQNTTYFYCDSCVINSNTKTFEAWGNVHINDADTANIYAKHLRYLINRKIAYLDGGVTLSDGKGSLTTPDLEYDMTTDIGIYKHGGKVVNKKTVLTSREGFYYAGLRDVYFKGNVELKDPAYYIKTDSLLYNTLAQRANFITYTYIRDSTGRTVETRSGYYNIQTGKAEFGGRPVIVDGSMKITGETIAIDDSTGISQAKGNVVVIDTSQKTTIIANTMFYDKKRERLLATDRPLMIIKQDNDSIYVTADTLFSARLSDLQGKKDSLVKDTAKGKVVVDLKAREKKDSTNRYFEAFRHVRIFTDSLQAVSDSLFYSFRDSTFRLYQNPVVWAKEKTQITGDTILVFTKNKKADRIKVFENSFLVNMIEPEVFNQIKSARMDGYFTNGDIDSVRAKAFAECIYYIQNEHSSYLGINESKADVMDIYFRTQQLQKVVFRTKVTGTIWPIQQKSPKEMRLENFQWQDARRPKTKYELY